MGLKRTDEFRQDAVRIALTSGLTRKHVAADLGVGMSTLNKWITAYRDTDVVSKEDLGLAQENDRRAEGDWPECRSPPRGSFDASERHIGGQNPQTQGDNGQ